MKISLRTLLALALIAVSLGPLGRAAYSRWSHGMLVRSQAPVLAGTTILLIRHAEKPDDGDGLTPAGELRAQEYVRYFQRYAIDGRRVRIDAIYAARDTPSSMRPRLTVTPLSKALGLPIDTTYKDKDYQDFARMLQSATSGKTVVVCWHHREIPDLLAALGADPGAFLPGGRWPSDQYGWVIQLCYDRSGHLDPQRSRRVDEDIHVP